MNKDWVLTQELFDALLQWLDPDRERAAQRYENIRRRLITIFTCRGSCEAEDLADETINRVAGKLSEIRPTFDGDPARYFYGVANKVYLEYLRRPQVPRPPPSPDVEARERECACLERCLEGLNTDNRELFVRYYQYEKREKIEHRKSLADQLGIALNALRIRAHRIRASLHVCVQNCLEKAVE